MMLGTNVEVAHSFPRCAVIEATLTIMLLPFSCLIIVRKLLTSGHTWVPMGHGQNSKSSQLYIDEHQYTNIAYIDGYRSNNWREGILSYFGAEGRGGGVCLKIP